MTETEQLLALLNDGFPDITALAPLEARAAVDGRVRPAQNLTDAASADFTIRSPGGPLAVRSYLPWPSAGGALPGPAENHPADNDPADRSSPPHNVVTVFAHGGGFLHGSIASHDSFCRLWVKHTNTPVVSVEVRLAPEHAAPAGAEDLVATADWVLSSGFGRNVVLAGDSSGANAAAVAALMLRDRGERSLIGQVLLYPFLDPSMDSASYRARATGFFVTARALAFYWQNYLEAGEIGPDDWRVNPARASTHRGLPPTVVITAGLDPLADEGRDYARTLRSSSVTMVHRHHPDQFHGFATIPNFGPAQSARDLLWSDFRRLFSSRMEPQA